MRLSRWTTGVLLGALSIACFAQAPAKKKGTANIMKQAYGKMPDGTPVDLYTLTNAKGMQVGIITYGGAVASLTAPDRNGKYADVVLGMDSLAGYQQQTNFFGALIGRYGNRIGKRAVPARRQDLPPSEKRRPEHPARRTEGVRQAGLAGQGIAQRRRPIAGADLRQQGWRGGLPRNPDGEGGLYGDRGKRAAHRLHRHHG